MRTTAPGAEEELESLTQFLYLAPIGLVQASIEGEIALLNPMSAQLLMPLARDAQLTNLFDALEGVAPDLRALAQAYPLRHGRVCDNLQLQVPAVADGAEGGQVLNLTLLKLDDTRLMAVLGDVSVAVRREAMLRQSRSWITTILSGRGGYALMSLDADGRVLGWNPGIAALTGFTAEQATGHSCAIFDGKDDGEEALARAAARLETARREGWHLGDGWCRRSDGSGYPGSSLLVPVETTGDHGPAFSLVIRKTVDAAESGAAAAAVQATAGPAPATHDALLQFLYQAPIGLLQTDGDGEITMINPMSAQLLMPLVADGNLLNLYDALGTVLPDLRQRADAIADPGGVVCDDLRFEVPAADRRGPAAPRTLAISLLRLDADTLVASLTDVSLIVEREQAHIRSTLQGAARVDSLTQLPNRSVALERIATALAERRTDPATRFAVIVVNCDRFDRINVTLGPAVGDDLLRAVGRRLAGALRPHAAPGGEAWGEPAAARLGADVFVLVVRELADGDAAAAIARRVVDLLGEPYVVGEHRVHLTASLGVVDSADASGDAEELLQGATIAMQEAKRAGGARWHRFDPAMKDRAAHRGSVESELRGAIAAGELFVVYQPIVALGDGRGDCTGVEALVRWRHPVRGIVPPIEFIEIAEETGLIGALGSFVLHESCAQLMRWERALGAAAPRTVSVNVSKAQLHDGRFVTGVGQALATSGLPPARLQLEVTESLAGRDEAVRAQLHQLKALGLAIALDDFGTGYSSLSSLHQLPVDVVKIDRSFVSQLESSAHHRVLVEATVKVARSLGMGTVAEGIETEGQAAELARLGCDKAQGYLFARPMEAEAAARWLQARAGTGKLAGASGSSGSSGASGATGGPAPSEPCLEDLSSVS